jgi:hypothetical protein
MQSSVFPPPALNPFSLWHLWAPKHPPHFDGGRALQYLNPYLQALLLSRSIPRTWGDAFFLHTHTILQLCAEVNLSTTTARRLAQSRSICAEGYLFEVLNVLEEKAYISQTRRAKSPMSTEVGVERAEEIEECYTASYGVTAWAGTLAKVCKHISGRECPCSPGIFTLTRLFATFARVAE